MVDPNQTQNTLFSSLGANSYLPVGQNTSTQAYADALAQYKKFFNLQSAVHATIFKPVGSNDARSVSDFQRLAERDTSLQNSIEGILSAVERLSNSSVNTKSAAIQAVDLAWTAYLNRTDIFTNQFFPVPNDLTGLMSATDLSFSSGTFKASGFITGFRTVTASYDLNISMPGNYRSSDKADIVILSDVFAQKERVQAGQGNDSVILNFAGSTVSEFRGSGNDAYFFNAAGGIIFDSRHMGELSITSPMKNEYRITDRISGEIDVVVNPFEFRLADTRLRFDQEGSAGQVYRLYQAAFDRTPDRPGLTHNVKASDEGMSLLLMADAFIRSPEFVGRYGANTSNEAFIRALYRNVLDRDPDPAGFANHSNALNAGTSRAQILVGFSESLENKQLVGVSISLGIALDLI